MSTTKKRTAKKKVAASRKPSKVLTAAQIAKTKDAILADKEEVKELKASLKEVKAQHREAMKIVRPIEKRMNQLERRVGVVLSKIETKEAKLNGC